MSAKWRKRLIIFAVLILAIFVLRSTVFAPKPVEITVYKVQSGRVEETVTNSKAGTVKVRHRAKLSPEVGGRVAFLDAREGQNVKAGQLLLKLDDEDLRAALLLAQRALESAKSSLKEACVAEDLAERELQRNRQLFQQGIIAQSVLDQAENRLETARARCEAAGAEVKRADANVQLAKANLKKAELRAPFAGTIAQVSTELGEWITPSPPGVPIPPVIDILDASGIYIEAPIDETDAGKLRISQPVRITLDPYPDRYFRGTLTRIAPFVNDIEGQNRTVDVEAEFEDNEFASKLLAGTSADLEVILAARNNVVRIPTQAIIEGDRVLVVEGDHLVSRRIKTGLRNWEYAEVVDGVKPGQRITLSLDLPEVKEGAFVKVKEEAKT